jgi:hypothetical protein
MSIYGRGRGVASPSLTESRWLRVLGTLNEYQARLFVADRAIELGRGGVSRLARLTGMSRMTITKGVRELRASKRLKTPEAGRVRQPGGGRKKVEEVAPVIGQHLTRILEETTAGDPMSLLKWTSKSTRAIAEELTCLGHPITGVTVGRCLRQMGYSLPGQRQDQRRAATSQPRCAIPLPQPTGQALRAKRRPGHFGGHQEERIGGSL